MASTPMSSTRRKPVRRSKFKKFLKALGPGLITGASDDDPSGIVTYAQAGAMFGLATLWTALITFPLMAAIQGMSARIGMVTTQGLTGTLKTHYPKAVLYGVILFCFPAVVMNIGADIQSMGAVASLLIPAVPTFTFSIVFTVILMYVIIQYSYQRMAGLLKWLCLALLLYLIIPFLVHPNWGEVARHTFIPEVRLNKEYLGIIVAILGTTISPYLFFWQATMEAEDIEHSKRKRIFVDKRMLEDMRKDVNTGMLFSNVVTFFLILTAGVVLNKGGVRQIDTVEQAAHSLKPLAGQLSYLLFAIGVIGTGFLAIPVLAGCVSYMLAETFNFSKGLDKKFYQAKEFYGVIIVSLVAGLCLQFLGISAVQALVYTAILYGLTAPVMIALLLHIGNNKKIMGKHTNSVLSNILGWMTLLLMTAAAVGLVWFQFFG
ncbi:MAG TPA: divalent metal cation transporter [Puia sp.]|jgi:NRAMP (natural resistance-associated macrophage protein)-like metal ion transporter|nr:divalent metal cation transporter [Puia sp.]